MEITPENVKHATEAAALLLGAKPIATSVHCVVKGSVDGARAFLSRLCLPAAEEFGLMLQDGVRAWRIANMVSIANKAERKVSEASEKNVFQLHASPRVVSEIIDRGSWTDDDMVQELWAGLLVSACTPEGKDDSSLMFIDLLHRLSLSEVRMLKHFCENVNKRQVVPGGFIVPGTLFMNFDQIKDVAGVSDMQLIDRELDYLRALGLLGVNSGFGSSFPMTDVSPSALALQMYARCCGSSDPVKFYALCPSVDTIDSIQRTQNT